MGQSFTELKLILKSSGFQPIDKWNTFYIKLSSSGMTCSIQNLDFFTQLESRKTNYIKLTPNISYFIHNLFNARNYFSSHFQVNILKFLFWTFKKERILIYYFILS